MGTYRTASLDRTAAVMTTILIAAPLIALIVGLLYSGEVRYAALTITTILSVVCAASYAIAPSYYVVKQDKITVKRHLWRSSSIPMSQVKKCYPYPQLTRNKLLRLVGNGGAFGWYGIYASDELGTIIMYATNRAKAVVVGNGSSYVLSPERQDTFLAAVQEYAQSAADR
jgi:hypothetical protein